MSNTVHPLYWCDSVRQEHGQNAGPLANVRLGFGVMVVFELELSRIYSNGDPHQQRAVSRRKDRPADFHLNSKSRICDVEAGKDLMIIGPTVRIECSRAARCD